MLTVHIYILIRKSKHDLKEKLQQQQQSNVTLPWDPRLAD